MPEIPARRSPAPTVVVAAATAIAAVAGIVVLAVTGHGETIPVLLGALPAVLALFRIESANAKAADNNEKIGEVRSLVNGHTERIIESTRAMAKEAVREAAMTAVREAIKLPPEHAKDAPAAAGVTAEAIVNEKLTPGTDAVKAAHRRKAGTPAQPKKVSPSPRGSSPRKRSKGAGQ